METNRHDSGGRAVVARTRAVCVVVLLVLLGVTQGAGSTLSAGAPPSSCAAPSSDQERTTCSAYERAMLDATVLLRMRFGCAGLAPDELRRFDSHATAVGEHLLLTHNHYDRMDDPTCRLAAVDIFDADGRSLATIRDAGTLAATRRQLRAGAAECREESCVVSFPAVSVQPVEMWRPTPDNPWPGTARDDLIEVGQIDWDGAPGSTHIHWRQTAGMGYWRGAPVIELGARLPDGASGGGVFAIFRRGPMLIGNNWLSRLDQPGSVAALNTLELTTSPGRPKGSQD